MSAVLFGRHINRYYLRYAPALLVGILALVIVDYVQLVVPRLYQMVINGINNGSVAVDGVLLPFDMDFLLRQICLPLIVVILSMVAGRFVWRICFFGSGIRVETDLRRRMFDRCKDLSQQYYQVNKVGDLMALFTNDLETVQDCFGSGILMFCDALFLGALSVVKMGRMNWKLTLLCLIPMALLMAAAAIVGKYMELRWDRRQAAYSALSDFAQEAFSGIAVIKAFVKESRELLAFRKLNKENEDTNVAYTRLAVLLEICITLLVEAVICIILGYGGWLVHEKVFNAGQLVEFIGYFTAIVWPVMAVAQLIEMRSRGKASLARIGRLLEAEVDVADGPRVTDCPPLTGAISFRDLTFRYPGAQYDALSHVTLDIAAGERVGIVGRVGSGKTTLVDLILRTHNVPDGALFLDGRDVNTIPIRTVRACAAYVPQDNFLFSDTISRNIAFASDRAEPEELRRAAELAGVHDNIVEFPNGYDTLLGERGVTVSGGQKQRISIARALMKNAPILILDDSVSAVDVSTERQILSNLRTLREGKTTILIAHRISTVEQMDKVVYMDEGTVVDVGTHAELCARCPGYRTMVELQKLDDENGSGEVKDRV